MSLPEYFVCVGLATLLFIAVRWCLQGRRYYLLGAKIPGPRTFPLLGNILSINVRKEDIFEYFKELHQQYGPVCRLWFGTHLVVVLGDPKDIAIVLNSSKTLSKAFLYSPFNLVFNNSLLTATAVVWRKFRKIMSPAFSNHVINSYVSTFHKKSQMTAEILEKHAGKESFDVADYIKLCTIDAVAATSLGEPEDIQDEDKPCPDIQTNFKTIFRVLSFFLFVPLFWFTRIAKLTHWYKKGVFEIIKPRRNFVEISIKQKTDLNYGTEKKNSVTKEYESYGNQSKQHLCFLEHMLSTLKKSPELFTFEELVEQAMLILSAGSDTSASTVAHTLVLLGLHQDVQIKVLREQEDIFGEDLHRPVTVGDLKEMVYLEQVINETMRLYPVVPIVARRADEDVRIDGYSLPAGTTIAIPINLVHRNPAYFPNPEQFDPERFSKENSISRPSSSYIPFSSGPRMCIGKYYAYILIKTMLSVILRKYQVLEYGSRDNLESSQYSFFIKFGNRYNIRLATRK